MVPFIALRQPFLGSCSTKQGKATLAFIYSAHSLHPHHLYSH
ncbi:hypothetical protein BH09DEP1_BH09DEP1_0430 [soil metagenome]